jgi:TolB-like protein
MPDEPATPDLVRLTRQVIDASNRMQQPFAWAMAWERSLAVHVFAGMDTEKVRVAAERVAEERMIRSEVSAYF